MTQFSELPFVNQFSEDETQSLSKLFRYEQFPPGSHIFASENPGSAVFFILKGEVELRLLSETAKDIPPDIRTSGDVFGESTLLTNTQVKDLNKFYPLCAQAKDHLAVLRLDYRDYDLLANENPRLALRLLKAINSMAHQASYKYIKKLSDANERLSKEIQNLKEQNAVHPTKYFTEQEVIQARQVIMESILDSVSPTHPIYDFGMRMIPAKAVGGDFFDFIPLSRDRIGIAIGDVSDKGLPAALFMAVTRSLLQAEAHRGGSPDKVLQRVNRNIIDMNNAAMFITVFFGILDFRSHEFSYCRAGHEIPFLVTADHNSIPLQRGQGQPLGIIDELIVDVQTIIIPPGGTLILYSDGVPDALDPNEIPFSRERLESELKNLRFNSAQEACNQIVSMIMTYQGTAAQFDDITLCAIHRNDFRDEA
ncbi:MAG TPA: SpoIIE family protein phosphatase [Anaerolineaceae bacterium]